MKKITLIFALFFASGIILAQGETFTAFYNKYSDSPDFTKVSINQKMFKLFADFVPEESDEDKEVMELISKLKGFKLIASTDGIAGQKYYKEAKPQFTKGYEELMTVKDGKDDMVFLIKEKNNKIEELVMLIGGHDKFVAMSLFGEIDIKQVSKLAKKMNIDGMDYLQNLDENE